MSDETLREELLSWQAGQRELHRWKLIALGGVAALALGLTNEAGRPQLLVLCLVPFIAAYCDVLSRDYDLRIALIASYLFTRSGVFADYERFIQHPAVTSSRWWHLGTSATMSSSLAACLLTVLAALLGRSRDPEGTAWADLVPILVSAVLGALLVIWVQRAFVERFFAIKRAATELRHGGE